MTTIEQFMWGYQTHFRRSIEFAAEQCFGSIKVHLAPTALLIGFEEEAGGYPICIEPERIGLDPGMFDDCTAEGDAEYERHDRRKMFMSDARSHQRFHDDLRDKSRAESIAGVINSHPDLTSKIWFVGRSARVGRYRVYPAIGVLRSRWDELPTLSIRSHDHRTEMFLSLQEAVIREVLQSASFALSISDEPSSLQNDGADEMCRRATKAFVRQLVFFKGDFMGGDLDSAMNLVAAQPYEGRTGVGTILMAAKTDYSLELAFRDPIRLNQTRALRKALEMTDPDLHLIADGNVALGLGRLSANYTPESETAFFLRVIGRGAWELEHAATPLLSVLDGQGSVPRQRLDQRSFEEAVARIFDEQADVDRLWQLALAASRQLHGTMLVVHSEALDEARRLSPPAMSIEPGALTDATLLAVSAIDGAMIVSPQGDCHAIGAILDGRAVADLGDASRGARYNSAQRYLAEAEGKCLIIVVSEDGMLNLIPDLPRRIKRSNVESVLSDVESLSKTTVVDFEAFFKREEHLRSLAFYLTLDQCRRANDARERVERYRESSFTSRSGLGAITRVGFARYKPNSRLDDSFFLEESEIKRETVDGTPE